jgi:hypothetical protein
MSFWHSYLSESRTAGESTTGRDRSANGDPELGHTEPQVSG